MSTTTEVVVSIIGSTAHLVSKVLKDAGVELPAAPKD